jgi:hypothetical protein
MGNLTPREVVQLVQQAGYSVAAVEHPRTNRWLLTVTDGNGLLLIMLQERPLIGAADVQDLAELVRLRCLPSGVLVAHRGTFSPAAYRTSAEFGSQRIRLCTTVPLAFRPDVEDSRATPVSVNATF